MNAKSCLIRNTPRRAKNTQSCSARKQRRRSPGKQLPPPCSAHHSTKMSPTKEYPEYNHLVVCHLKVTQLIENAGEPDPEQETAPYEEAMTEAREAIAAIVESRKGKGKADAIEEDLGKALGGLCLVAAAVLLVLAWCTCATHGTGPLGILVAKDEPRDEYWAAGHERKAFSEHGHHGKDLAERDPYHYYARAKERYD